MITRLQTRERLLTTSYERPARRLAQQLWQLRYVGRNAPRLVTRQQLGRRSADLRWRAIAAAKQMRPAAVDANTDDRAPPQRGRSRDMQHVLINSCCILDQERLHAKLGSD